MGNPNNFQTNASSSLHARRLLLSAHDIVRMLGNFGTGAVRPQKDRLRSHRPLTIEGAIRCAHATCLAPARVKPMDACVYFWFRWKIRENGSMPGYIGARPFGI